MFLFVCMEVGRKEERSEEELRLPTSTTGDEPEELLVNFRFDWATCPVTCSV